MTDLTRERLAELRGIVNEIDHPFKWYDAHDLTRTRAMPLEDARLIAAMEPRTVLSLIAQCEAGLPASGGVSGDLQVADQRYPDLMLRTRKATEFALAEEVSGVIAAILAERDGLKQSAETNLANARWALASRERIDDALSASNATLADALGLLREARRHVQADQSAGADWHHRVKALLANHPEPSP